MAGNSVQVTFGANIAPLIEGVNAIKEQIAGLGSAVQALAGAFAGGAIAEFVDSMAGMGEQIEHSAAMLGASVATTQEFGYAAKMSGGDAQSMATAMERFEVSLQRALNPTSQQALALRNLGLSAKELIGLPLQQQMDKFADAVARLPDGPNKTAWVGEINRGFVQMIPMLDQGSAGLKRLHDEALNTGAIMTKQTVTALSDLDHHLVGVRASLSAMAGTLTALAGKTLGDFAEGVATTAGHLTALASTGNLSAYVFGYLDEVVDNLGYRFVALAHAIGNLSTLNFAHLASDWARDEAALLANAKAEGADLDKILNGAIASYKNLIATQERANTSHGGGGTDADAMKAAAERAQAAIKAADESYKATQSQLAAEVKLHEITYTEETQKLMEALGTRYAAEIAALSQEQGLYAQGSAQWQKVLDQEMAAYQKYIDDKRKLDEQASEQSAKDWESAIKPIESAWNSQLRGLLSGTETWAQAMHKMAADLVIQIIEEFEKVAVITPMINAIKNSFDIGDLAVTITKMITGFIGPIFAGMTANLSPKLGPAAVPVAAGIAAGVEGIAVGMSKLDVGGTLLSDGVYYGHAGETVVPASVDMPYGGGGGGNTQIHNWNISAWDSSSVQRWLTAGGAQQISRSVGSYERMNPSSNW